MQDEARLPRRAYCVFRKRRRDIPVSVIDNLPVADRDNQGKTQVKLIENFFDN